MTGPATGKDEHQPMVVPCKDCSSPVEVSGEIVGMCVTFSTQLRARGEDPIRKSEIVRCAICGTRHRAEVAERIILAHDLLTRLRHTQRAGTSPGMVLIAAPQWFKLEYEREIAHALGASLSTRTPPEEHR